MTVTDETLATSETDWGVLAEIVGYLSDKVGLLQCAMDERDLSLIDDDDLSDLAIDVAHFIREVKVMDGDETEKVARSFSRRLFEDDDSFVFGGCELIEPLVEPS